MANATDIPVTRNESEQLGVAVTPEPDSPIAPTTPTDDAMGKATNPGPHQEQGGMRS